MGRAVHPFDEAWNTMYGVGAVLMLAGLCRVRVKLEVLGLILFAGATGINGVAILYIRGATGLNGALLVLAAAVAAVGRIHYLAGISRRPQ